jgi:hypothetical protein
MKFVKVNKVYIYGGYVGNTRLMMVLEDAEDVKENGAFIANISLPFIDDKQQLHNIAVDFLNRNKGEV